MSVCGNEVYQRQNTSQSQKASLTLKENKIEPPRYITPREHETVLLVIKKVGLLAVLSVVLRYGAAIMAAASPALHDPSSRRVVSPQLHLDPAT